MIPNGRISLQKGIPNQLLEYPDDQVPNTFITGSFYERTYKCNDGIKISKNRLSKYGPACQNADVQVQKMVQMHLRDVIAGATDSYFLRARLFMHWGLI